MPVVVLVGGFMCPRSFPDLYWGEAFAAAPAEWKVIVVPLSPVASTHDRACQLYWILKGGTVRYGQSHAATFGHAEYDDASSVSEGLYPDWDQDHQLHFIAHSMGGNTVRLMLQLMREHDDCLGPCSVTWVASLTCLSAPLNGVPAVYGLGGDVSGTAKVRWGSAGFMLSSCIGLLEGVGSALSTPLAGGRQDCGAFGLAYFFRGHKNRSSWLVIRLARVAFLFLRFALPWPFGASPEGRALLPDGFAVFSRADNLAYDAQVVSALRLNERIAARSQSMNEVNVIRECDHVYFFSVAGTSAKAVVSYTKRRKWTFYWVLSVLFEYISSWLKLAFYSRMHEPPSASFSDSSVRRVYEAITEGGRESGHDGVCPSLSMLCPRLSGSSVFESADLHDPTPASADSALRPGVWYHERVPTDHLGIVGAPHCRAAQRAFFEAIYARLGTLMREAPAPVPKALPWE